MPDIPDKEVTEIISKYLVNFLSSDKREKDFLEMANEVINNDISIRQAPLIVNRNNGEKYLLKITLEKSKED